MVDVVTETSPVGSWCNIQTAALRMSRGSKQPGLFAHFATDLRMRIPTMSSQHAPKPRLLILDEDRIILQSLSQFLRREGYEVSTADRPDDALARSRERSRSNCCWPTSTCRA